MKHRSNVCFPFKRFKNGSRKILLFTGIGSPATFCLLKPDSLNKLQLFDFALMRMSHFKYFKIDCAYAVWMWFDLSLVRIINLQNIRESWFLRWRVTAMQYFAESLSCHRRRLHYATTPLRRNGAPLVVYWELFPARTHSGWSRRAMTIPALGACILLNDHFTECFYFHSCNVTLTPQAECAAFGFFHENEER